MEFVDQHRHMHGVEPICRVLQIAPSGYRRHAARLREPSLRSDRAKRDDIIVMHIERVWRANLQVYGVDKVWRQLQREGHKVARCTVERLMCLKGLRGVMRGKVQRTTFSDPKAPCPLDPGSTGTSRPSGRTSCGSATSRMSRPGRVGCTWPSSSMCLLGELWAGG